MCQNLKTISKNKLGELHYCNTCKTYHVLFNNIHFILNQKQINSLKDHIKGIDVAYWEHEFGCTSIKRKIPILTCQDNLILIFDKHEFNAFKSLFFYKSCTPKLLKANAIDYNLILN